MRDRRRFGQVTGRPGRGATGGDSPTSLSGPRTDARVTCVTHSRGFRGYPVTCMRNMTITNAHRSVGYAEIRSERVAQAKSALRIRPWAPAELSSSRVTANSAALER